MALLVSEKLKCFLLLVWLQLVYAEIPMAASRPITKPGCQDRCGNVSIPYPFGIGDRCFLEESFELRCNNSVLVDHPKPISGNFYVSNISISSATMIADVPISTDCSGKIQNFGYSITDSFMSKFTFSATKNKLTAIGCNIYAYLGLNSSESTAAAGCMSMCNTNTMLDSTNGSCNGIGCCQASVPSGLREFTMTVGSLTEIHKNTSFNPCTYAFLIEKNSFHFSSSYLKDFKYNGTRNVPVAIDWSIGNETCHEAQGEPTSYACGPNSDCITGISGSGYRCACKVGYEGNPYLKMSTGGECQDIDECASFTNNCVGSNSICINSVGSYKCGCEKGYYLVNADSRSYCLSPTKMPNLSKIYIPKGRVVIVATVSAVIVTSIVIWVGYWLYNRYQKRKQMKLKQEHFTRNGGLLLNQKITSSEGGVERAAKIFVAEELEKTTDNFNPSRIIGKGGFGTVACYRMVK